MLYSFLHVEHIESKIHKELDMRCPKCRKFLSYSWIYRKMSKEGRERYEASLLENFRHAARLRWNRGLGKRHA